MCARHEIDVGVLVEAAAIARSHNPAVFELPPGDVAPSAPAAVAAAHRGGIHLGIMRWGLPRYDGKGLIINTRSETALEKPMFRESTLRRRCAIPARSFCEWDRRKQKVTFSLPEMPVLWMAGIYDEEYRYSVLTTGANDSVSRFHDRMPLLLTREELGPWLLDDEATEALLHRSMPALAYRQEDEQMALY